MFSCVVTAWNMVFETNESISEVVKKNLTPSIFDFDFFDSFQIFYLFVNFFLFL